MQRFKNMLINLSLKDDEASVLKWTGEVSRLAQSQRITALHAWNPVDLPNGLKSRYPWLLEPGEENLSQRMSDMVSENLDVPESAAVDQVVKQGSALGEVLALAESGETDLVVCGRSAEDIYISEKLARKAPCSVLSVPPDSPANFKKVLIASDFSTFSDQALDVAIAFAHSAGTGLTILHAFTIPWGEAKATTARPEIISEFRQLHEARLRQIVGRLDTKGVEIDYEVVEASAPLAAVKATVEKGGHGLVVIGCRGRHAIYATLLGSTAEAILHGSPVPVLAVKSKGTAREVLAALREN